MRPSTLEQTHSRHQTRPGSPQQGECNKTMTSASIRLEYQLLLYATHAHLHIAHSTIAMRELDLGAS